jgi:hypothetical protein
MFSNKSISFIDINDSNLKWKLEEINVNNVLNLGIDILNLEEIHFFMNEIKEIDSNLLNGLGNLKIIDFSENEIKEINPKLKLVNPLNKFGSNSFI